MRVILFQPRRWHADGMRNLDGLLRTAERSNVQPFDHDLVVLPELVGSDLARGAYLRGVKRMAGALGSWIVGGSHHDRRRGRTLNRGVVVDPTGSVVTEYEKLHPYAIEARAGVNGGAQLGTFEVEARRILVLLCADFWYADPFTPLEQPPDVVLVPAFSITQRPSSQTARALWRHMAVARAYEFCTFVGISDWAAGSSYEGHQSSGVAGLANPNPRSAAELYRPLAKKTIAEFPLEFAALEDLRDNRRGREFRPPPLPSYRGRKKASGES